jgi:Xaa-Pro aminopeptidase
MQIAIDSAIFPKGTNGAQLDVLARKNLWQDGLNYSVSPYTRLYFLSWLRFS